MTQDTMTQVRRFEVLRGSSFRLIDFERILPGDIFRAFEADGTPVEYQGFVRFRAETYPKPDGSIDMITVR